jgi:hypothetical protein
MSSRCRPRYVNNLATHRIEIDPMRGPIVARLFGREHRGSSPFIEFAALAHVHCKWMRPLKYVETDNLVDAADLG